jgi:hypothetical protein
MIVTAALPPVLSKILDPTRRGLRYPWMSVIAVGFSIVAIAASIWPRPQMNTIAMSETVRLVSDPSLVRDKVQLISRHDLEPPPITKVDVSFTHRSL